MKIIGKGDKDKYLVEIEKDELARFAGYYYKGSSGCPELNIGDEVKLSEMFYKLYHLSSSKKEVKNIQIKLKEIIDLLDITDPILSKLEKI